VRKVHAKTGGDRFLRRQIESRKHLFTLETAISSFQTEEMSANNLQLVLPRSLHATYTESQQHALLDLESFIGLVRERQDISN
jgi:hypothetical protein